MNGFSERSLKNMEGVNPKLIELMKAAIIRSPINFGIPADGGKRTAERQKELFTKGLSKCDGYKIKGNHQSGNAVDVYAFVDDKASWDIVHLAIIAGAVLSVAAEMELKIRWGGTFGSTSFKGWDMPHFEIQEG